MHDLAPNPSRRRDRGASLSVALLILTALPARSESWQVILPAADFAPKGLGTFLMVDPYSTGPAPGLLFAGYPYDASLASVTRITPLDAGHSGFAVQPLNPLDVRAREVVHNPGDGLYVAGESPWNVRRSSEENQGQPGTWEVEDTFRFSWVTGTGKKQTVTQGGSRSMGAAVDANGGVWVAGNASDAEVNHWIVRYKPIDGTWQLRLDLPGATAASRRESRPVTSNAGICYFPGNAQNPTPALLAFGILNSRWAVVRNQPGQPWQDTADGSDSWSQRVYPLGADSWSRGRGMVDDGHIFVAGYWLPFHGRLEDYFDGLGVSYEGSGNAYIARILRSGELDWIRLLGGTTTTAATSIAVDHEGNHFVGGSYAGAEIRIGQETLPATAGTSAHHFFVARFSPDGEAAWVRVGRNPPSSFG